MVIITSTGAIIELDATIKAGYSSKVDVTKFGVEVGSPITDHTRLQPEEVEVEGIISDAEIPGSAMMTYQQLKDLRQTLITLVGTYETYENMTPTNVDIPEDDNTGEGIRFKMPCQAVRQVTLQTTLVGVKKKGGKASNGQQGTTATTKPLQSKWHKQYQSGPNPTVPLVSGGP